MLMEVALTMTEILTRGTATYTRPHDPYAFVALKLNEPAADPIADALSAAGADANVLTDNAKAAARAVLNLLADLPNPTTVEVQDNEIILEWYKDRHHVAVIAVDGQSISWSVMAGHANPLTGKKPFDNAIPPEAVKAISAVAV
jgi:hypothetical protein